MQNHDEPSSKLPVPFQPGQPGKVTTFVPAPFTAEALDAASTEGVVAYWRMVMRHKWIVVLSAMVGTMAGILITLPQTPVYQSRTSL